MENELHIFNNNELGELGILIIGSKPYFPAIECAKVLGYPNPHEAVLTHCRYLTKREVLHPQRQRETIEINFIPEADLYKLIIRSTSHTADKFENWVFDEILPSAQAVSSGSFPQSVLDDIDALTQQVSEIKESLLSFYNYSNVEWLTRVEAEVKALAKRLDIDGYEVLSRLYAEISEKYDINLEEYRADYCYANGVNQCTVFTVIESYCELRDCFDVVLDEMLGRFDVCADASLPKRETVFDRYVKDTAV